MSSKMKHVQDSSALFKDTAANLSHAMLQAAIDSAKRDLQAFDAQTQNKLLEFEERFNNLPATGGNTISDDRLEDLFKELQDNPKFAALFANACVTLNGVKYTNNSLLESLYLAPKLYDFQFKYDANYQKTGAIITLTDGRSVLMDRTWNKISADNDPDEIWQERFYTNAWPNAVVGEPNLEVEVYENWVKRPTGIWQSVRMTNFVFGLVGNPCPYDVMASGIDINKDGKIGTQQTITPVDPNAGTGTTEPNPVDPNAGTGTTEPNPTDTNVGTGTGDTGTGDTGTGTTEPNPTDPNAGTGTGTGDTGTTEPNPVDPDAGTGDAGYQP